MSVANIPFDVAEYKVAAPSIRPGTVAKADLIARLRSAGARLTTIVAPAGYGKTTLLARWAESDPRSFAWVSLDGRDDDDPGVFLRYIAAALFGVGAVSADVLDVVSGPAAFAWTGSAPAVGTALLRLEQPIVLVLDDLHLVDNRSCLDILAELVLYVPPGSQIAVTSREAPALPLARWRSQGWVQEIGVTDLRLDDHEAGLLLDAAGVELDPTQVSELTQRTEGWPSGLYLAALSLQAGAPQSGPVEALTGNDRFVSEYFRFELLSRLPPDEVQFLTYTSVLDRMCGGLCDAVLETTGSAETLSRLRSTNGFVVPLDRTGEWHRYHHLFRQLLRDELERSEPGRAPELNRRAMAWCLANELGEAGIQYGQAAGETDAVAGLVDALSPPLYYEGRLATAEEWLAWFGDDELMQYPALAVYGAWWSALTGRVEEAERLLAIADGATSKIPLSDGSPTIEPWVATLRAHMMPSGVEQSLADADAALDQLPPDSFWVPTALLGRGVALALLGESDRAREVLSSTVERALATGSIEEVFLAQAQLAFLAAREGAWGEAGRLAGAAQARVEEAGLGHYSTSSIAHVAAARVAMHEARPDEARTALVRAHRLRPMLNHALPWETVRVGIELTRVHLALGDAAAARTTFRETEQVLALRPGMGVLVEDAGELREQLAATSGPSGAWAMSLTGAELRLLPYLATHLTIPEIATRLFISRNTVKTEAVSIYRKLSASSRSEAIEHAVEVGLLDSSIYPQRAHLTIDG